MVLRVCNFWYFLYTQKRREKNKKDINIMEDTDGITGEDVRNHAVTAASDFKYTINNSGEITIKII